MNFVNFFNDIKEALFINMVATNVDIFMVLFGLNLIVFGLIGWYVKSKTIIASAWRKFSIALILQGITCFLICSCMYHTQKTCAAEFLIYGFVIVSLFFIFLAAKQGLCIYQNKKFNPYKYLPVLLIFMFLGFYAPAATIAKNALAGFCFVYFIYALSGVVKMNAKLKTEQKFIGIWLSLDIFLFYILMFYYPMFSKYHMNDYVTITLQARYFILWITTFAIGAYYWVMYINTIKVSPEEKNENNIVDYITIVAALLTQIFSLYIIDNITDTNDSIVKKNVIKQAQVLTYSLEGTNWNTIENEKPEIKEKVYEQFHNYFDRIEELSPEFMNPRIYVVQNGEVKSEVYIHSDSYQEMISTEDREKFLNQVYTTKETFAAWPYLYKNKMRFAVLVPIIPESTNQVNAVLALNISTDYWLSYIVYKRALYASISVLICMMLCIAAIIGQRLKEYAIIVASNEKRLNEAQSVARIGSFEYSIVNDTLLCSDEIYNIHETTKTQKNLEEYFNTIIMNQGLDSAISTKINEEVENRIEQEVEYRIVTPKGHVKDLSFKIMPRYNSIGEIVSLVGTIQDITARKEIEDTLTQAKNTAEEANAAKSQFLANMSH